MAKVTWIGEDHVVKREDGTETQVAGPSFTMWGDVKFPKGTPVELQNPAAIAKAKGNRFFKVEEADPVRFNVNKNKS